MRHVIDSSGTSWQCSDLGLPAYAHADAEAADETPRVLVTAVSADDRRSFLAPLTWESTWSDDNLLQAIRRIVTPTMHRRAGRAMAPVMTRRRARGA